MPSLTELASYLESIAPAQIAESWDNVGVLVRCAQEVTGVLCALDITPATVREARAVGCQCNCFAPPGHISPFEGASPG